MEWVELVNDWISLLIDNISFMLERLNWLSVLDITLVTLIFFGILMALRDTQTVVLLRGILLLVVLVSVLNNLDVLPAFSWLVRTTLPTLLLAIPVIFAPEIRRALERLGRAGYVRLGRQDASSEATYTIAALTSASVRLSDRKHGALMVVQRIDALNQFIATGVRMDARLTPELLLQIFYPNTPLHDGAVIISGSQVVAASCVMPLSASGVLTRSPERQMGLRHRAALGISEITDAIVVVVSEQTGAISVVHDGRMIRRLDEDRLRSILTAFYHPPSPSRGLVGFWQRLFGTSPPNREEQR